MWQEAKPTEYVFPSQKQGEGRGLHLVSLLKIMDPVGHSTAQAGGEGEVEKAQEH